MEIESIFVLTDQRTQNREEVRVSGPAGEAIKFLRLEYPKRTKFVFEGHDIDGNWKPLKIR